MLSGGSKVFNRARMYPTQQSCGGTQGNELGTPRRATDKATERAFKLVNRQSYSKIVQLSSNAHAHLHALLRRLQGALDVADSLERQLGLGVVWVQTQRLLKVLLTLI